MRYDHYVARDWSLKIMAVARMGRRDQIPRVFERPADVMELKEYLKSLKGRTTSGKTRNVFFEHPIAIRVNKSVERGFS